MLYPIQNLTRFHNFSNYFHDKIFCNFISKLIDAFIRIIYSAAIPAGAKIDKSVHFGHNGLAVVINKNSVIHANVFIGSHVILGGKSPIRGAPCIESNAVIHAGAILIGPIRIGRGAVVAANSVVLNDVPDACLVAGIPAKIIKSGIDSQLYNPLIEEE